MKILITGGAGHIGTNMCFEAMKRGHEVVVMDNLHRRQVVSNLTYLEVGGGDKFSFVWGDIRSADDFDRIPKVDAVIHLAANPGVPWSIQYPIYDFEANARGTLNVLEFARKSGNIPVIYASTNKTFSDIINEIPIKETETRYKWTNSPLIVSIDEIWAGIDFENGVPVAINEKFPVSGFGKYGHSMYGISKLVGDLYCQEYHIQYGLPVVINKMSCIYGLFQKGVSDQGWMSFFIQKILNGDGKIDIFGTGKQVRDVLDARDLSVLYLDELERIDECNGEIFTVGGGPDNTASLLEAIKEIEKQTGKKAELTFSEKRPADQDIYISSIKHVGEVLGWKPTIGFNETVSDMLKEYGQS